MGDPNEITPLSQIGFDLLEIEQAVEAISAAVRTGCEAEAETLLCDAKASIGRIQEVLYHLDYHGLVDEDLLRDDE